MEEFPKKTFEKIQRIHRGTPGRVSGAILVEISGKYLGEIYGGMAETSAGVYEKISSNYLAVKLS